MLNLVRKLDSGMPCVSYFLLCAIIVSLSVSSTKLLADFKLTLIQNYCSTVSG